MEKVGIYYGHLECFMAIWNILWLFCYLVAIWYIFLRFGKVCQEKSGNPGSIAKFLHSIFGASIAIVAALKNLPPEPGSKVLTYLSTMFVTSFKYQKRFLCWP
jgi:hypothetical protein